ncbi:MAG: hypothetical protein ACREJ3_06965, partial [Polyangiaceae bacterium]
ELIAFERGDEGPESAGAGAVSKLADAMVRYSRDPARRRRHGRTAREHILKNFDAREHAARIQDEIVLASALARSE